MHSEERITGGIDNIRAEALASGTFPDNREHSGFHPLQPSHID